jgi:hypothetical protein
MERKARGSDTLGALKGVVEEALPITAAVRGYWRIWFGFWERAAYNPVVAKVMRARYDEWRGRLAVLISRAQSEGAAPTTFDADLAAQELVALVDGIAIQVLLGTGRIPAARQREIIDNWIGLMVAGHAGNRVNPAAERVGATAAH